MMDIEATQALRGYSDIRKVPNSGGEENTLFKAAADFQDTLAHSEQVAKDALVGKADPHALVEALTNSQPAIETAVTVRDKVVEAYQEILRMPV